VTALNPKLVTSQPRHDLCPVTETIKIIGKKWYLIILHELTRTPRGFNELKKAVRGISAKVLSESLADLERRGLVHRRIRSESPIRVEYSLTAMGQELAPMFDDMKAWGERWAVCETPESHAHEVSAPVETSVSVG